MSHILEHFTQWVPVGTWDDSFNAVILAHCIVEDLTQSITYTWFLLKRGPHFSVTLIKLDSQANTKHHHTISLDDFNYHLTCKNREKHSIGD